MARPLREGTLGEPPAPLPSHPACGGGGGGATPPTHETPPSRGGGDPRDPSPTRLSCGGRGDPPGTPPEFGVYGWGAHGDFGPSEPLGTPQIGGTGGGPVPNGRLPAAAPPGAPPSPEQILGARLRLLGDNFQHSYERQRRGRGLLWAPLLRWVAPWIGAAPAAPLAARGGN
ncbi:formin-A-like [Camarhynchus parvulus]|uniref:formin-A-like n=1 Tax=Geospiza parvula TaxID=87175 RepID=UPI0012383025|nr:formin-A-like [Camarhynchus parvulus]